MRYSWVIFQFLFLACTIIEDSDITTQDELDNLSLKSVQIEQATGAVANKLTATTTSESKENIVVPGGVITKFLWMDWPALTAKVKLKSGYTQKFKSYISYLKDGKPYTFYLFDSDSVVLELYRFRYDGQGRLNLIMTHAPYIEGGPPTTKDSLIYNISGNPKELSSIIRKSNDASKAGTFMLSSGSTFSSWFAFDFQGITYSMACQGNGCGPYWGGGYFKGPSNNGFPQGVMNWDLTSGKYSIQDVNQGISSNFCQGQCKQSIDTYYLHPLMIFKDQFELGETLLFFYSVDWWQPVAVEESTSNESVTFSYKYDL